MLPADNLRQPLPVQPTRVYNSTKDIDDARLYYKTDSQICRAKYDGLIHWYNQPVVTDQLKP